MTIHSARLRLLITLGAAIAEIHAHVAFAQDAAKPDDGALSEVVVTAQARAQRDLDVPIALTTLNAQSFQNQGFKQLQDVGPFIPNVYFSDTENLNATTTIIRGLGTSGSNFGFEQAVPMFIDGIHYGRGAQTESAMVDVDQLAVLKGPQPVYFGMNATAGAISITSRKPGKIWEGYVLGEAGNDNARKVEFGSGGPLTDTFGVRFAGKYEATDGYLHDSITGVKYPAKEDWAGRVTAVWTPLDSLNISAKFEKSAVHQNNIPEQIVGCTPRANLACGVLLPGTGFQYSPGNFTIDNGINDRGSSGGYLRVPQNPFLNFRDVSSTFLDTTHCQSCNQVFRRQFPTAGYIKIDWDVAAGIKLTSESAYSGFSRRYQDDFDATPFLIDNLWRSENLKQYSEELRLVSPAGGVLEWVAGAYWEKEDLRAATLSVDPTITGTPARDRLNGNVYGENDRWASGFFSATLNFFDHKAAIDFGGRYTDVQKNGFVYGTVGHYILAPGQTLSPFAQVIGMGPMSRGLCTNCKGSEAGGIETAAPFSDSDFNPQVVLRYKPNDQLSFYAKWATAFKAGGFVSGNASVAPLSRFIFGSEHADTEEVGLKSSLLDNRLDINFDVFQETYKNLQVSVFDPTALANETKNAGKARSRGVELDSHFAASSRLTLGLAASYLDAKYLEFNNASCNDAETAQGLCPNGYISRAGQRLQFAPEWQASADANYSVPLKNNLRAIFNGQLAATAGSVTDDAYDNTIMWKAHTSLNLLLGVGDQSDTWQVSLWGRNLTQPTPTYDGHPINPYGYVQLIGPLRTYGVQAKYNF